MRIINEALQSADSLGERPMLSDRGHEQGTRRRVDLEGEVVKKHIKKQTQLNRNVNEWFIWNMVRHTQWEPVFTEVICVEDRVQTITQKRVFCFNDLQGVGELRDMIDSVVAAVPLQLRQGWQDKRGRPHYHTWGVNAATRVVQLYDYESMDRVSIGLLIQTQVIPPLKFWRPRCV